MPDTLEAGATYRTYINTSNNSGFYGFTGYFDIAEQAKRPSEVVAGSKGD